MCSTASSLLFPFLNSCFWPGIDQRHWEMMSVVVGQHASGQHCWLNTPLFSAVNLLSSTCSWFMFSCLWNGPAMRPVFCCTTALDQHTYSSTVLLVDRFILGGLVPGWGVCPPGGCCADLCRCFIRVLNSPEDMALSSMNEGRTKCKRALGFHAEKQIYGLALRSKANEARETKEGGENKWAEEWEFVSLITRGNDVVLLTLLSSLNPQESSGLFVKIIR